MSSQIYEVLQWHEFLILAEKLMSSLGKKMMLLCYFVIIKYSNFITYVHRIHTLIVRSFVALFKDEYKLPKGSVIELSRESNHVLKISSKFIYSQFPFPFLLISVLMWSIYFGLSRKMSLCCNTCVPYLSTWKHSYT